jgi:hypothetical protein
LIFKINGQKKSFDNPKTISDIRETLRTMSEFYADLLRLKGQHDSFDEKEFVKNQLECAKDCEKDDQFKFMTAFNCNNFFPKLDDNEAAKRILKSFRKSYGKNSISPDPDRCWTRFYTTNVEEITAFEKHVNLKFVKPFLEKHS